MTMKVDIGAKVATTKDAAAVGAEDGYFSPAEDEAMADLGALVVATAVGDSVVLEAVISEVVAPGVNGNQMR